MKNSILFFVIVICISCSKEQEFNNEQLNENSKEITLDDIEKLFGKTIRNIIDGLTKISENLDLSKSSQAESFKKMFLTIPDDVRVILIKLADRLHNMRTLGSMREDKKLKIAASLIQGGQFMGLLGSNPNEWFTEVSEGSISAEEIEKLIRKRQAAKGAKDFEIADKIRNQLLEVGIKIQDGRDGTSWRRYKL